MRLQRHREALGCAGPVGFSEEVGRWAWDGGELREKPTGQGRVRLLL